MSQDQPLIGGPERREIVIADPDPAWAQRYERERRRIVAALGDRVLRVDHIGSTSVPGLAAKPVIDIDLSVADPDDEAAYVPDLEAAGYVLRVREPGHRMLRTPERDVHVHVCALGSEWETRHLVFRDWLRAHPDDRQRYEDVKRSLAGVWDDSNAYADAKSDVIADIMRRALAP
ncbi:GrpB family protein [Aeromicrobium wangtongii]|uniref:GrpB family protein n=1 Tax=Aeromicrobium wangtongii TaxID=2969247 RepID=A0ABY5M9N1_9ACTN|nr:GrpB family protein [Aeromicrobium wangtongii]MCD9197346.1 GrpB family protein [Aeromicrobium wangtongii]UUP14840.1 GrpB family protein [Aeromicrobium wangtongii]